MKKYILLLVAIILCMNSCKKDESRDPEFETIKVFRLENGSLKAEAFVKEKGTYNIIDHGFIKSQNIWGNSLEDNISVSLGSNLNKDSFSAIINNFVVYNQGNISVRAYIKNSKGVVYSNAVQYVPVYASITGINPNASHSGDTIVVEGSNFIVNDSVLVKFNSSNAKIIQITPNKLYVQVPEGITYNNWDNNISVSVMVNGVQRAVQSFTLLPIITSFYPVHGTFGTSVTLKGTDLTNVSLYIDEVNVGFDRISSKTLKFSIPYNMTSVKSKIKIVKNNYEVIAPGEFTMDSMIIESISPLKGVEGSIIEIRGKNLKGQTKIFIGGLEAGTYVTNSNLINAYVPYIAPGVYDIEVDNGLFNIKKPNLINVVKPEIIDFSPKSGPNGTIISLKAKDMFVAANSNPSVIVGNQYAGIESWDSAQIKFYLPWQQSEGEVEFKVFDGKEKQFFSGVFTVEPSNISSFSPSSGTAGTIITINGVGFPADASGVSASLGSLQVPLVSVNPKMIKIRVPTEAAEGQGKITLTFFNQTSLTTQEDFTVVK